MSKLVPHYENRNVKLYQGDALSILKELPDNSVDAVITDPPYSSGGTFVRDRERPTGAKYTSGDTIITRQDFAGDNRDQRSYFYWCALWLGECLRISKPGSPICVFTDWRQLSVMADAIQIGGWIYRGIVPWNKTQAARPQKGRFRSQCEYVVWGSNGTMPLSRNASVLPGFLEGVIKQSDKHHQTGKPTAIMRNIVKICVPDGIILDPFVGSGTTCVAALLEGRKAIGIESSKHYISVATTRLDYLNWKKYNE